MSSDIAIRVDNLSKYYQIYENPSDRLKQFILPRIRLAAGAAEKQYFREFWALKNISFEIKKGETVGIIGCNGSGKSTLLQLICGTLNPSSGSITTFGRIAALLELGSGFNPEFTGRENIYLNAALLGLSRKEINNKFQEIVDFADIGNFIEQPVKTYSSGMAMRLAFAVAINADPEILIVDEALSVGDELFQRKCFSRIEAIRKSGATILFVSHSGGQIVELCDRAILIDSGEKLAIGLPKKIVGFYQKLLYSPEDTKAIFRQELYLSSEVNLSSHSTVEKVVVEDVQVSDKTHAMQERFDSELKPSSTIEYESQGAYIQSPIVLTLDNEQVNNLVPGRSYRYCYNVHFTHESYNVRFGMLIKTTSGVELGGCISASSPNSSLPLVEAGSTYKVEIPFRCALNPGIYFLNAGVVGYVDGKETYLHRLIDIAMFRVMTIENNLATGIIDFDCQPQLELINV